MGASCPSSEVLSSLSLLKCSVISPSIVYDLWSYICIHLRSPSTLCMAEFVAALAEGRGWEPSVALHYQSLWIVPITVVSLSHPPCAIFVFGRASVGSNLSSKSYSTQYTKDLATSTELSPLCGVSDFMESHSVNGPTYRPSTSKTSKVMLTLRQGLEAELHQTTPWINIIN